MSSDFSLTPVAHHVANTCSSAFCPSRTVAQHPLTKCPCLRSSSSRTSNTRSRHSNSNLRNPCLFIGPSGPPAVCRPATSAPSLPSAPGPGRVVQLDEPLALPPIPRLPVQFVVSYVVVSSGLYNLILEGQDDVGDCMRLPLPMSPPPPQPPPPPPLTPPPPFSHTHEALPQRDDNPITAQYRQHLESNLSRPSAPSAAHNNVASISPNSTTAAFHPGARKHPALTGPQIESRGPQPSRLTQATRSLSTRHVSSNNEEQEQDEDGEALSRSSPPAMQPKRPQGALSGGPVRPRYTPAASSPEPPAPPSGSSNPPPSLITSTSLSHRTTPSPSPPVTGTPTATTTATTSDIPSPPPTGAAAALQDNTAAPRERTARARATPSSAPSPTQGSNPPSPNQRTQAPSSTQGPPAAVPTGPQASSPTPGTHAPSPVNEPPATLTLTRPDPPSAARLLAAFRPTTLVRRSGILNIGGGSTRPPPGASLLLQRRQQRAPEAAAAASFRPTVLVRRSGGSTRVVRPGPPSESAPAAAGTAAVGAVGAVEAPAGVAGAAAGAVGGSRGDTWEERWGVLLGRGATILPAITPPPTRTPPTDMPVSPTASPNRSAAGWGRASGSEADVDRDGARVGVPSGAAAGNLSPDLLQVLRASNLGDLPQRLTAAERTPPRVGVDTATAAAKGIGRTATNGVSVSNTRRPGTAPSDATTRGSVTSPAAAPARRSPLNVVETAGTGPVAAAAVPTHGSIIGAARGAEVNVRQDASTPAAAAASPTTGLDPNLVFVQHPLPTPTPALRTTQDRVSGPVALSSQEGLLGSVKPPFGSATRQLRSFHSPTVAAAATPVVPSRSFQLSTARSLSDIATLLDQHLPTLKLWELGIACRAVIGRLQATAAASEPRDRPMGQWAPSAALPSPWRGHTSPVHTHPAVVDQLRRQVELSGQHDDVMGAAAPPLPMQEIAAGRRLVGQLVRRIAAALAEEDAAWTDQRSQNGNRHAANQESYGFNATATAAAGSSAGVEAALTALWSYSQLAEAADELTADELEGELRLADLIQLTTVTVPTAMEIPTSANTTLPLHKADGLRLVANMMAAAEDEEVGQQGGATTATAAAAPAVSAAPGIQAPLPLRTALVRLWAVVFRNLHSQKLPSSLAKGFLKGPEEGTDGRRVGGPPPAPTNMNTTLTYRHTSMTPMAPTSSPTTTTSASGRVSVMGVRCGAPLPRSWLMAAAWSAARAAPGVLPVLLGALVRGPQQRQEGARHQQEKGGVTGVVKVEAEGEGWETAAAVLGGMPVRQLVSVLWACGRYMEWMTWHFAPDPNRPDATDPWVENLPAIVAAGRRVVAAVAAAALRRLAELVAAGASAAAAAGATAAAGTLLSVGDLRCALGSAAAALPDGPEEDWEALVLLDTLAAHTDCRLQDVTSGLDLLQSWVGRRGQAQRQHQHHHHHHHKQQQGGDQDRGQRPAGTPPPPTAPSPSSSTSTSTTRTTAATHSGSPTQHRTKPVITTTSSTTTTTTAAAGATKQSAPTIPTLPSPISGLPAFATPTSSPRSPAPRSPPATHRALQASVLVLLGGMQRGPAEQLLTLRGLGQMGVVPGRGWYRTQLRLPRFEEEAVIAAGGEGGSGNKEGDGSGGGGGDLRQVGVTAAARSGQRRRGQALRRYQHPLPYRLRLLYGLSPTEGLGLVKGEEGGADRRGSNASISVRQSSNLAAAAATAATSSYTGVTASSNSASSSSPLLGSLLPSPTSPTASNRPLRSLELQLLHQRRLYDDPAVRQYGTTDLLQLLMALGGPSSGSSSGSSSRTAGGGNSSSNDSNSKSNSNVADDGVLPVVRPATVRCVLNALALRWLRSGVVGRDVVTLTAALARLRWRPRGVVSIFLTAWRPFVVLQPWAVSDAALAGMAQVLGCLVSHTVPPPTRRTPITAAVRTRVPAGALPWPKLRRFWTGVVCLATTRLTTPTDASTAPAPVNARNGGGISYSARLGVRQRGSANTPLVPTLASSALSDATLIRLMWSSGRQGARVAPFMGLACRVLAPRLHALPVGNLGALAWALGQPRFSEPVMGAALVGWLRGWLAAAGRGEKRRGEERGSWTAACRVAWALLRTRILPPTAHEVAHLLALTAHRLTPPPRHGTAPPASATGRRTAPHMNRGPQRSTLPVNPRALAALLWTIHEEEERRQQQEQELQQEQQLEERALRTRGSSSSRGSTRSNNSSTTSNGTSAGAGGASERVWKGAGGGGRTAWKGLEVTTRVGQLHQTGAGTVPVLVPGSGQLNGPVRPRGLLHQHPMLFRTAVDYLVQHARELPPSALRQLLLIMASCASSATSSSSSSSPSSSSPSSSSAHSSRLLSPGLLHIIARAVERRPRWLLPGEAQVAQLLAACRQLGWWPEAAMEEAESWVRELAEGRAVAAAERRGVLRRRAKRWRARKSAAQRRRR